ncbi:MAG: tryptophan-rich sensory protein [Provencibacterium sp.]|jgi:benzodiazapine receptor|nr:tryptophan-rich sensory protein [Provencibacterium sp.]
MRIDWKKALLSLGAAAAAALLGALLGGDMESVYRSLERPWYAPPPIVFPIAWSILYLLMAYAFYQALTAQHPDPYMRQGMMGTFLGGLLLNALWPMVFFRFQLFTLAFYLIVAMIALGAFTEVDFYRISRRAALCYLPYLVWLVFALCLNHAVAQLNG